MSRLTRWWDVYHGRDDDQRHTVTVFFPEHAPIVLSVNGAELLAARLSRAAERERENIAATVDAGDDVSETTITLKLDGRCGNCSSPLPRSFSYCPYCGARWTVVEPTMRTIPLCEVFAPPRPA